MGRGVGREASKFRKNGAQVRHPWRGRSKVPAPSGKGQSPPSVLLSSAKSVLLRADQRDKI